MKAKQKNRPEELQRKELERTSDSEALSPQSTNLEALQREHARTEELLRQERETFFRILQKAPYGVILIDRNGKYVYVNPEFTAITGYTPEEVPTGRDLLHRAYPDPQYRQKVREAWRTDILQKGVTWVFSIVRGDGKTREIEFKPTLLDDGRVIVMLSDVTERKQAEESLRKAREDLDLRVKERTGELSRSNQLLKQEIAERERVEKAHRESEERYHALVKHSSDGIFIFDPKTGKLLEANDQFLKMLGYRQEDVTQLKLRDIVTFENRAIREDIQRALESGQDVFGLRQYRRADGSFLDVEVGATLISYSNEQVVLVNMRDVTERTRAERALRESEDRYRAIFETTGCATAMIDEDMTISLVNTEFEKLSGYTKEEIEGKKSWTEFLEPKEVERLVGYHQTRREDAGAVPRNYEFQFLTRSGDARTIFITGALIPGTKRSVLSLLDITERKRAEEALRAIKDELELRVAERTAELQNANEKLRLALAKGKRVEEMLRKGAERYRDLFQNSPIGIYRANPKGLILMANHALVRMLGFSSFTEITTNEIEEDDYEPTYLRADFRERLEREGRVRDYEATWKRPDGTDIFVSENARAVKSEDGTVLYYEGIVEDITEKKKAEKKIERDQEELRSLASKLSLAEEQERRRIASILHDTIGQLLAVSKIKLWSLLEATTSDDLKSLADEARQLVEQAITHTRSLTSELSPPILYELGFEAALEWLGEQMQKQHGFAFTFDNDNEPKPVDEEMRIFLFTSVRELLVNIVKHARARNVRISARKSGEDVVIQVEDDGVGFLTTEADWGSGGFGLFSIRERLRYLGGRITIDSLPGHGTRVTLSVPSKTRRKNIKEKSR